MPGFYTGFLGRGGNFFWCIHNISIQGMIKTRLRNRLGDLNLSRIMRIAIEAPDLKNVNFEEILDIFKQNNHRIPL